METFPKDILFFGDNLKILREQISDESVDLIYLDPPFNSKADYNILFKTPDNADSPSQITAFEDSWHWTSESELVYGQLLNADPKIASVIRGMREAIGENDMMAYLVMMAIRLIELHRVLKDTGSLYLHCDPTASHYLKIILDAVFDIKNFRNEIIWHYQTGGASKKWFSKKHDIILLYGKSNSYNFYPDVITVARTEKALKRAKNPKGARISKDDTTKLPMDVWTDIQALNPMSNERMGYPTQKPVALLERILKASSKNSDVILDPFCGCGTTIEASQKLGRNWIGIDITHLAIGLIEKRMKDAFGVNIEVIK